MTVLQVRGAQGRHGRGQGLALAGEAPVDRRVLRALGTAVLLLACWAFIAPPALGGRTSWVITDGVSMLPKFHAGDLVILRRESSYHVGEVAAYYNKQLKTVVMHRIVAIKDGHYTFKGDNNTWDDTFEPTKSGIVGAEWLHLPGLGKYVEELRQPATAAVLLGLLWVISFYPRHVSRRQRRRHRHAR